MERKGFIVKHNFNNDFVELWESLKEKYGEEVFEIHGVGNKNLDMTKFPKHFYGKSGSVASVSIDDNANVNEKTLTQYRHERFKSIEKLNSIYVLYKWVKKIFSKKDASIAIENIISGKLFVNDLTNIEFPYCYAFDLRELVENGLSFYKAKDIKKPQRSDSFIQLVVQTTGYASNQIMGAVSYPSLFPILDWFYRKELGENYIEIIKNKDSKEYRDIKEQFQTLIFSLNFNSFRAGGQTPFTNLS